MTVIDDYLETVAERQRILLGKIRSACARPPRAPGGHQLWRMPGFKYKGRYPAGFCSYKNHLSLFPAPGPIEALKDKLHEYTVSKGTIRSTEDHPIPDELIEEIIAHQVASIDARK